MPWPFRRSPQSSSPSGAGTPPIAQREQRAEWRSLPPLSETMAPPPLVAPNSRFAAGLAVNNAPPPTLGHLGHQRSLDATPGLALGLAKPVSRSVDGSAAAGQPVPRRRASSALAAATDGRSGRAGPGVAGGDGRERAGAGRRSVGWRCCWTVRRAAGASGRDCTTLDRQPARGFG